jgi:hypothetical protein
VGLSRFPEDGSQWPDGSWSVELRFDQPPPEQGPKDVSRGTVRFVMDEAPQDRLRKGVRFSFYGGITKVADVDVLD